MAETRDPAIKLFGREIPVTDVRSPAAAAEEAAAAVEVAVDSGSTPEVESAGDEKDTCEEITSTELKDSMSIPVEPDQGEPNSFPCLNNDNENTNQASTHHNKAAVPVKPEHDQADGDTSGQEKVLKKPDKILPCPRCKSFDTKFCYYNNYNVNQPRHFCKNCQRYWTAGGTMRNVPVGAGRRKNKHAASHCRQIVMSSDGLTSALPDAPDSSHQALPCDPSAALPSKGNVTVLKFGPEALVSESIASVLNLQEQNRNSEPSPMVCQDNSEEPSCAPSLTAARCAVPENLVHMGQNSFPGYCNGVTSMHHLQCYPGHPWPYPWIPGWNSVAAAPMPASQCSEVAHGQENSIPTPMTWSGQPIMGAPAFCAPAIPFPFIPAPWGCMPVWSGGKWSLPYVGTNCILSPSSSIVNSGGSGNVVPNLGKHSRDASSQAEEKRKYLWAPKTLRIDDPEEASKSSIWATLGIKPDISGIFKGLQSKTHGKGRASDTTQALHANPAALSRSRSFQESTDVRL